MKRFISMIVLFGAIFTFGFEISYEDCMKSKYSHVAGGVLVSKNILKKRLESKYEKSLSVSKKEVLKRVQKEYPDLKIKNLKFKLSNCKGYYVAEGERGIYYFEPLELKLLKKYED